MRKIRIITLLAILLILVTLLNWHSSNKTSETLATIWMMGSPYEHETFLKSNYLFEINTNQTIKIITGNVFYDVENKKPVLNSDSKIKITHIKNKAWEEITALIAQISKKGSDVIGISSDAVEITAIINDKIYWSLYSQEYSTNEMLIQLTNEIIEISHL